MELDAEKKIGGRRILAPAEAGTSKYENLNYYYRKAIKNFSCCQQKKSTDRKVNIIRVIKMLVYKNGQKTKFQSRKKIITEYIKSRRGAKC